MLTAYRQQSFCALVYLMYGSPKDITEPLPVLVLPRPGAGSSRLRALGGGHGRRGRTVAVGRRSGGRALRPAQLAMGVGAGGGPTVTTPPSAHEPTAPTVSSSIPADEARAAPFSHIGTAGVQGRGTGGVDRQIPNGTMFTTGATARIVGTGSPRAVTGEAGTTSGVGAAPIVHTSRHPGVASGPGIPGR